VVLEFPFVRQSIIGWLGSASSTQTDAPLCARYVASRSVVVLLPAPPFGLETAITGIVYSLFAVCVIATISLQYRITHTASISHIIGLVGSASSTQTDARLREVRHEQKRCGAFACIPLLIRNGYYWHSSLCSAVCFIATISLQHRNIACCIYIAILSNVVLYRYI
jgi:hypothetical protein